MNILDLKSAGGRQQKSLKREFLSEIEKATVDFNFAATFTFSGNLYDEIDAQKNARQFSNRLNQSLFGNNWRRKSKHDPHFRVPAIAVLEGDSNGNDGGKRWHYHFAFAKPEHLNNDEFSTKLLTCWRETQKGGYFKNIVTPDSDYGWIEYITKTFKTDDIEALDIESTHIY
jgi:hypothetical protein